MSTQVNPYQSPTDFAAIVLENNGAEHVYFHGSMTMEEGDHIDRLLSGKKRTPPLNILKCLSAGILVAFVVGVVGYDLVSDAELGALLETVLGLLAIGALLTAQWWQARNRNRLLRDLKAAEQGIFTRVSGRLDASGIEFLANDFPVNYQWNDFIGYRADEDVVVLYVEYPHERNFLAASWFRSESQWVAAKAIVSREVPAVPRASWRRSKTRRPKERR